jgi:hypothetical protein
MTTDGLASARAETVIDRSADDVWGRIRDFSDVSWILKTDSSRMEGDLRSVRMKGATTEVDQQLLAHDDADRTYTYRMATVLDLSAARGPGAVADHLRATITVTPIDESSSTITWDVETHDFMAAGVSAEYQRSLDNLKSLLEA